LYPDIAGLAQSNVEMLSAFFGEGLQGTESPWYSHAIRWRNNRRTARFLKDGLVEEQDGQYLDQLRGALPVGFKKWGPLARAQYLEISIFLSQYLLSSQGDRMGMAHSIEGRFPFLDVRMVEFCNALEPRMKLRCLHEKHLLKEATRPWLPDIIRHRPKRPYRAPVHRSFFNAATPDYVKDLLAPAAVQASGLFKAGPIEQLVRKMQSGAPVGETDDMALAGILSTQLVHQLFIKDFRRPEPISAKDRIKVVRLNHSMQRNSECASQKMH
jgi:asparagine synthase (glutamine-hydrolysing)